VDERHTPEQPYTIHEDVDAVGTVDTADDGSAAEPARPSGPDPLALVAGLTAIVIAVLALTGTLAAIDPRWVLAIAAVGIGCAVLVVTLRRRG
jgi:hypothetical protein